MKNYYAFLAALAALLTFSCNKSEIVPATPAQEDLQVTDLVTKTVGSKTPTTFVYVETNDVNPLNAMNYYLADDNAFFDYVCFFSSNIHKETIDGTGEVRPTLYLNPELCPYICNNGSPVTTYTEALHGNGQEAILGVLGDWQSIGLSTMTDTQAYQFAYILCCVVTQCGFDGVLFDDEYSGTNTIVNDSYSKIIIYFKQLCPTKKVFVFDWGGTSYISSTAAALIDYAHHGYFGYYVPYTYSNITGMTAARWSPISLELGQSYGNQALTTIQTWAYNAKQSGYGQIMFYNLRTHAEVDPTPVLNKIATGAGWSTPVVFDGSDYAQLDPVTGGCTITYDMAINCCGN